MNVYKSFQLLYGLLSAEKLLMYQNIAADQDGNFNMDNT